MRGNCRVSGPCLQHKTPRFVYHLVVSMSSCLGDEHDSMSLGYVFPCTDRILLLQPDVFYKWPNVCNLQSYLICINGSIASSREALSAQ